MGQQQHGAVATEGHIGSTIGYVGAIHVCLVGRTAGGTVAPDDGVGHRTIVGIYSGIIARLVAHDVAMVYIGIICTYATCPVRAIVV